MMTKLPSKQKMILPIRCFTCGNVIANKWEWFDRKRKELETTTKTDENGYYVQEVGKLLDELGLKRICCRRHLLTHVDLIEDI